MTDTNPFATAISIFDKEINDLKLKLHKLEQERESIIKEINETSKLELEMIDDVTIYIRKAWDTTCSFRKYTGQNSKNFIG